MKTIPVQTEEELQMVKAYLLLPIILDILERDVESLCHISLKMKPVYVKSLRKTQDRVTKDLFHLRRKLAQHGIKIYEERRTELGIEADYLCRGYQHRFSMLWGFAKAEIERSLSVYLDVAEIESDKRAQKSPPTFPRS